MRWMMWPMISLCTAALCTVVLSSHPAAAQTVRCGEGEVMVGLKDGQPLCEWLGTVRIAADAKLATKHKAQHAARQAETAQLNQKFALAITETSEHHYTIKMGDLQGALDGDLMRISRHVRVVPHRTDGKPDGFRLFGIRRQSPVKLAGFKNGDILTAVNGSALNTPTEAIALYAALKLKALPQTITASVSRKGKPVTLTYRVEP